MGLNKQTNNIPQKCTVSHSYIRSNRWLQLDTGGKYWEVKVVSLYSAQDLYYIDFTEWSQAKLEAETSVDKTEESSTVFFNLFTVPKYTMRITSI